jgi:hypothetical protein
VPLARTVRNVPAAPLSHGSGLRSSPPVARPALAKGRPRAGRRDTSLRRDDPRARSYSANAPGGPPAAPGCPHRPAARSRIRRSKRVAGWPQAEGR